MDYASLEKFCLLANVPRPVARLFPDTMNQERTETLIKTLKERHPQFEICDVREDDIGQDATYNNKVVLIRLDRIAIISPSHASVESRYLICRDKKGGWSFKGDI